MTAGLTASWTWDSSPFPPLAYPALGAAHGHSLEIGLW